METKIIAIVILSAVALCSAANSKEKFADYEVYKIESRLYTDGVLSVRTGLTNLTDAPKVTVWSDDAGQKWRLESSSLYSAFQLRPTSYESFVLEQTETDTFLKWVASLANFGNHKMWYLLDAGNDFTLVKNKHFDTCLSATGQDQPITTSFCTNSEDQQWKFVKLS